MTDGQTELHCFGMEFKRDFTSLIPGTQGGYYTMPMRPMTPLSRTTPSEEPPYGRRHDSRWWTISNAAYGTVLSTAGAQTRPQPFILPAVTQGQADAETQHAIEHFNAVLCRFYSDTLLPLFYTYTGRLRSFHGRDGPVYVNAKQYHGILRRRIQRAKLMKANQGVLVRKKYLHESRHRHATKRLRNAHGRFISKVKTEESTTDISSEPSASVHST